MLKIIGSAAVAAGIIQIKGAGDSSHLVILESYLAIFSGHYQLSARRPAPFCRSQCHIIPMTDHKKQLFCAFRRNSITNPKGTSFSQGQKLMQLNHTSNHLINTEVKKSLNFKLHPTHNAPSRKSEGPIQFLSCNKSQEKGYFAPIAKSFNSESESEQASVEIEHVMISERKKYKYSQVKSQRVQYVEHNVCYSSSQMSHEQRSHSIDSQQFGYSSGKPARRSSSNQRYKERINFCNMERVYQRDQLEPQRRPSDDLSLVLASSDVQDLELDHRFNQQRANLLEKYYQLQTVRDSQLSLQHKMMMQSESLSIKLDHMDERIKRINSKLDQILTGGDRLY